MTTRKQVKDQVVGKTQAAAVKPTTVGIARTKMIMHAVQRGIDCADTVATLVRARDSADPASQEIANRLMANKEFVKAMAAAVESILADVRKLAAAEPNDKPASAPVDQDPAAGRPQPEGSEMNGADYPEANTPANDPDQSPARPAGDAAITGTFAAYLADNAAPDIERRAAEGQAAEAVAKRKAVLEHVRAVGSAEDIARVSMGLDRRPYTGE